MAEEKAALLILQITFIEENVDQHVAYADKCFV